MKRSMDEFWKEEEELRKIATQRLDPKAGGTDRKSERPARKTDGLFRRLTRNPPIPERGQRIERRKA
jgi:hypothetical protein